MAVSHWDFEGLHRGETVWVLGSGRTLEYVSSDFFDGKTVVATNHAWQGKADHAYVCSNHWGNSPPGWNVVPENRQVPEYDHHHERPDGPNVIHVPTIEQKYNYFDPFADWPERGRLIVGPSSIHLAVHWAVWLGAAHIVLVGVDCGEIDGENNLAGYYPPEQDRSEFWHRLWEDKLQRLALKVRSLGVSVHSLNPWVTFNLEGHSWQQVR